MFVVILLVAQILQAGAESTDNRNLKTVVQVFRHGQRTPFFIYENDPNPSRKDWHDRRGQLTNELLSLSLFMIESVDGLTVVQQENSCRAVLSSETRLYRSDEFAMVHKGEYLVLVLITLMRKVGKRQLAAMGRFTRERYNDWLGVTYSPDILRVQTTDYDRTHMSAQCNLIALFPPRGDQIWDELVLWQPIPVHMSDPNIMSTFHKCPAYSHEFKRVLTSDPYFLDIKAQYADVFAHINKFSVTNVTSLTDMYFFYDTLMVEEQFGFSPPAWTREIYPEPTATITGHFFQALTFNRKLARLGIGPFLNELLNHFETIMNSANSTQKFQMYSAHEANIIAILSVFGAFDNRVVPFACSVYFELRMADNEAYVDLFYKSGDELRQITMAGCSFHCPLDQFKSLVEDLIIDKATVEKQCNVESRPFKKIKRTFGAVMKHKLRKSKYSRFLTSSKYGQGAHSGHYSIGHVPIVTSYILSALFWYLL